MARAVSAIMPVVATTLSGGAATAAGAPSHAKATTIEARMAREATMSLTTQTLGR